jgi:dTDP-4-dehydrorhamnose reductase
LKKKILILGSTGLIGHQIHHLLSRDSKYEIIDIAYRNKLHAGTLLLDIMDEKVLNSEIIRLEPDYVINCVGTLIKESASDPELAIYTNSILPHKLKNICNSLSIKLMHMSTDCVFSGKNKEPYREADLKDGLDVYAKTKAIGEIIEDNHLTIRTSVIGPELKKDGEQLFNWFMSEKGEIEGFSDAIWSGVTSLELAKGVNWAIENDICGLYQLTNGLPISKNEVLKLFKKYTNKKISIRPISGINIDKSFIDTRKLINYPIPTYEEMISEMIDFIKNHLDLYPHYKLKDF